MATATRSVNLELQPSKIQVWRASCQDRPQPTRIAGQDQTNSHSVVWEDTSKSKVTSSPVPLSLVNQPPWRRPRNASNELLLRLPNTLRKNSARAQTADYLLSMYVRAASPHMLLMSFVPEHEARTFDTQVTAFRSQLIQRDATSALFFLPLKLGGLGVGSAVQRHAAASWRAWQSVIPTLMAAHAVPTHRHPLHLRTTAPCPTRSTANHTLTTNEQARLPP